MLYVDIDMPKGALLPDQGVAQDPRGIVFDAATLVLEDTRVTGWRDLSGTYIARPATPNDGHAKSERLGARAVLRLRDKVNCGFALEDLTLDLPCFSVAVMFASPIGRASTLITLNPREGRDYLFLSESDGAVELKFRESVAGLSRPCPVVPGHFNLVCASVHDDEMKLAVNGETPDALKVSSSLQTGRHDMFIGCRSDRTGIKKTLGEAQITRLWIWPGEDIFANSTYPTLTALWQQEATYEL